MSAGQGRYVLPSFVERTSHGVKELGPYNKLFEERIIFLGAPIDDTAPEAREYGLIDEILTSRKPRRG